MVTSQKDVIRKHNSNIFKNRSIYSKFKKQLALLNCVFKDTLCIYLCMHVGMYFIYHH